MNVLKKIFDSLYRHYDKVLLGVLLVLLSIVMLVQYKDMKQTREEVAKLLGTSLGVLMGKPDLPTEDTSALMVTIEPDDSRLWNLGFNAGPITSTRNISPEMSKELQEFVIDNGPSTIFDPPIYVSAMDRTNYVFGYETKYNYYTGLPDAPSKRPEIDDPENPNPEPVTQAGLEFFVVGAVQPKIPFLLKQINVQDPNVKTTWDIQVDIYVNRRRITRILHINDEVPGTDYKIVSAAQEDVFDPDAGINRKAYTMTVENRKTAERHLMASGKWKAEGVPKFKLWILYPETFSVAEQIVDSLEVFRIDNQFQEKVYYRITDETLDNLRNGVTIQEVSASGKPLNRSTTAKAIKERDFQRYVAEKKRKKADRMNPTPGDDPMMPPEGEMP